MCFCIELGSGSLNIGFAQSVRRGVFCDGIYHHYFVCAHTNGIKQTSDGHHEPSNEHNTNKRVCLVQSIQKTSLQWFIMSADPPAIMFANFFHEKYLLAVDNTHLSTKINELGPYSCFYSQGM